jgi:hypothetical protein
LRTLNTYVLGHCHDEESTCQAKFWVFSSEQIPIFNSSAVSLTTTLDLSTPRFVLCQHLHLSTAFLAAHF